MNGNQSITRVPTPMLLGRADSLNPLVSFRKNKSLLWQLTVRAVKTRYQASALGLFWGFFTPFVLLCVYTFMFGYIFKAQLIQGTNGSKAAYALVLLCGLAIYNFFSESVNSSTRVVAGHMSYVKKVVFPLEMLPVAQLLGSLFFGVIWLGIAMAGIGIFMDRVCVTAICLPLLLLPMALLTMGLCWIVASLGVYLRDLAYFMTIFLQILLYMTPIFYSVERIPEAYRWLIYLNPLTVVVDQTRQILIFNHWPAWSQLFWFTLVSLAVAQLGYVWFIKTKKGFADVI